MKRYIILSAMFAIALNLSAQSDNPGRTRKAEDDKEKVKETRSTQGNNNAEVRQKPENNNPPVRQQQPERKEVSTPTRRNESVTRTTTPTRSSSERGNAGNNRTYTGERSNGNPGNDRKNEGPVYKNQGNNQGNSGVRSRGENSNRGGNNSYQGNSGNQGNNGVRDRGESGVRSRGENSNRVVNSNNGTRQAGDYTTVERVYTPRNEQQYAARRKTYVTPERHVVVVRPNVHRDYVHRPVEYRRNYYPYRVPSRPDIIWNIHLYNEYSYLYPDYDYWYYPVGHRINTISTYDADRYIGEFARIYGEVFDVWFSDQTNEYYFYFGGPYPYQDFTVIVNAFDARRFSRRPERFFPGRHIAVTGIVSVFEGKPEMLIKRSSQIDVYH